MSGAAIRPKLSKRAYFADRFGADAPPELITWQMVKETGWTLEYIRGLSMQDFNDYMQIKDGLSKARQK